MTTLTVTLSDEVAALARAGAAAAGCADLGQYVEQIIRDEASGGPANLRVESDDELAAVLGGRIDGPFVETGPADFARMREELEASLGSTAERRT